MEAEEDSCRPVTQEQEKEEVLCRKEIPVVTGKGSGRGGGVNSCSADRGIGKGSVLEAEDSW